MLSHLLVTKGRDIFVNAAAGDTQEIVLRRAARIALKESQIVYYQVINQERYVFLSPNRAKEIMTPKAWVEELRDSLSDPLNPSEVRQLEPKTKVAIIAELKRQRKGLHQNCLKMDKEIIRVRKSLKV